MYSQTVNVKTKPSHQKSSVTIEVPLQEILDRLNKTGDKKMKVSDQLRIVHWNSNGLFDHQ